MEFMSGGSVEDVLRRDGPMPADRALRVALDIARGLQYAEGVGLVHRDIKPGNLMIHDTGIVKIGDLGIAARSTEGGMAAQKGGVSGSPHYISPEQARGQDLDVRADIYSLGASMFQMLVGRPPFQGSELRELLLKQIREPAPDLAALLPEVPPAVPPIVAKCLEKNRDLRYANARQLVAALEEALAGLGAPETPSARRARTFRLAGIAAALLAVLIAAGAGGGLLILRYRDYLVERERNEGTFTTGLETARAYLQAGRLEDAEAGIDAIAAEPALVRDFPRLAEECDALRQKATAARKKRTEDRRRADADAEFAALRSELPDPAKARTAAELEACVKSLETFARDHPATPAAEEARKEAERARTAIQALEGRFARGREALRSLILTVGTFLDASPPRYREALERLRAAPPEIRGTPAEKDLEDRIGKVTEEMVRAADAWAKEAEAAAAAGSPSDAAARLARLRDRVEGKALERIDGAIAKLRDGG
jgi:hypothetical protein